MNTTRTAITEFEVVSIDGRDMVTIIINGTMFDTTVAIAKVLAGDIRSGAKRAEGK